jgi:ribose transport system permease protein
LAFLVLAIVVLNPTLLDVGTLATKSNAALTLILVAVGQTFVILTGGIDLSVGGIVSVTNSLAATQMTNDPATATVAFVLISLFGLIAGAINGFVVGVMRVSSFVATLATWSIWSGVALLILDQDGGTASKPFKALIRSDVAGLPGSLILVLMIFAGWSWLKRSSLGSEIFAIGSNRANARLSGASVVRTTIAAYALSGLFAAFAGIYRTVQVGSGSPLAGNGLILPSVAAVVLGGTSLAGGRGGIGLSIIGALILLFLNDFIFFLGVSTFYTPMVQGVLLVAIVALGAFTSLRRARQ